MTRAHSTGGRGRGTGGIDPVVSGGPGEVYSVLGLHLENGWSDRDGNGPIRFAIEFGIGKVRLVCISCHVNGRETRPKGRGRLRVTRV